MMATWGSVFVSVRVPHGDVRLVFRVEGEEWVCYMAPVDGMERAIRIGSIRRVIVREDAGVKDAFMGVMQRAFELLVRDEPVSAPLLTVMV
jgi:hypothetical protein